LLGFMAMTEFLVMSLFYQKNQNLYILFSLYV
jgi:hypothetical protein